MMCYFLVPSFDYFEIHLLGVQAWCVMVRSFCLPVFNILIFSLTTVIQEIL